MKKKELKNLAKRIAEQEKIITANEDSEKVRKAMDEVIAITNMVTSLEDIVMLDDLIQDFLKNS